MAESTTADNLAAFLIKEQLQFTTVRTLKRENCDAHSSWPDIVKPFPSLVNLDITFVGSWAKGEETQVLAAVGDAVSATLQHLRYDNDSTAHPHSLFAILRFLHLPNLGGIRHLELPMLGKDDFACEAGLALLDVFEKRSISMLCRYGYMCVPVFTS
mgnify:CR=1 FL=1